MNLKNILWKSIAVLIVLYFILGNFAITGLGIAEVIAEEANRPEMAIEQSIEKYVQYEKENYKGAIIQTKINVLENAERDKYIPIQSTQLSINVPSINGVKPTKVTITKVNTQLTTGKINNNLNQNYDKDTGLFSVLYGNSDSNTEYKENAKDEFEILYIYPQEAFITNTNKSELVQVVNVNVNFIENRELVSARASNRIMEERFVTNGEVTNYEIINTSDVYKGYMYSDESNGTNYVTDYKTTSELTVNNSEIIDNIKIGLEKSKFNLSNNQEIDTNTIQYKSTKISEEEFKKIFGQDGAIRFYLGNSSTEYASIKYITDENNNKKFTTEYRTLNINNVENGKVVYPSETLAVRIETTKPISEGILSFENEKRIISASNYGDKVENLSSIKESRSIIATKSEIIKSRKSSSNN